MKWLTAKLDEKFLTEYQTLPQEEQLSLRKEFWDTFWNALSTPEKDAWNEINKYRQSKDIRDRQRAQVLYQEFWTRATVDHPGLREMIREYQQLSSYHKGTGSGGRDIRVQKQYAPGTVPGGSGGTRSKGIWDTDLRKRYENDLAKLDSLSLSLNWTPEQVQQFEKQLLEYYQKRHEEAKTQASEPVAE